MEKIKNDLIIQSVKKSVEEDDLKSYIRLVEQIIQDDFSSVDIATTLLKMIREN